MKISVLPANATNADLIILALVGVYLCTSKTKQLIIQGKGL